MASSRIFPLPIPSGMPSPQPWRFEQKQCVNLAEVYRLIGILKMFAVSMCIMRLKGMEKDVALTEKTPKTMFVTKTLLQSSLPRICVLSAILQSLVGWRTQEGPTGYSFNVDVKTSRSRENPVCMQENCTHTHTHVYKPLRNAMF